MACPEGKTQDGYETQFGTNHLGHFLFFQLLKGTLLASSTPKYNSRVVRATTALARDASRSPLTRSVICLPTCQKKCLCAAADPTVRIQALH